MTKADLMKALEPYPDDIIIAGYNEDGSAGERYYRIEKIDIVIIEWIFDIISGIESKPSIVLKR